MRILVAEDEPIEEDGLHADAWWVVFHWEAVERDVEPSDFAPKTREPLDLVVGA